MSEQTAVQAEKQPLTPFEFIQTFPDAPSENTINAWKEQVPGGRIKFFVSPDQKRVYILRGFSALEQSKIEASLPINIQADKRLQELQTALASFCCLWTNTTKDNKLSVEAVKLSGAYLAQTLSEVILQLSDFVDPETIDRLSADL